jgi:hypothetical protein
MRRLFRLLDSRFVSRVGNAGTPFNLMWIGLGVVVTTGLAGASVLRVAGWIPVACFGVWTATSLLLVATWMLGRAPITLRSPFEHLMISRGLPGSSEALQRALALAEQQSREFIAEASIMNPVNNSKAATEFAHSYGSFEAEVALR